MQKPWPAAISADTRWLADRRQLFGPIVRATGDLLPYPAAGWRARMVAADQTSGKVP